MILLLVTGKAVAQDDSTLQRVESIIESYKTFTPASGLRREYNPNVSLFREIYPALDVYKVEELRTLLDAKAGALVHRDLLQAYIVAVRDDAAPLVAIKAHIDSRDWTKAHLANSMLFRLELKRVGDRIIAAEYAMNALKSVPEKNMSLEAALARYEAWQSLAVVYSVEYDTEMSLTTVARQIEYAHDAGIQPDASDIFFNLIRVLIFDENFVEAERLSDVYLDSVGNGTNVDRAYAHIARGRLLSSQSRHEEAMTYYRLSENLSKSETAIQNTIKGFIAQELASLGRIDEAQAILSDPDIRLSKINKLQIDILTAAAAGDFETAYTLRTERAEARYDWAKSRLASAARAAKQSMLINSEVIDARTAEEQALREIAEKERALAEERALRARYVAILMSLLVVLSASLSAWLLRLLRRNRDQSKRIETLSHEAGVAARSKQRFVSLMSHEFRTPLNHIMPVLNNYIRHTSKDARGRTMARVLDDAAHRMLRMFEEISILAGSGDILDYSPYEFELSDIGAYLEKEKSRDRVLRRDLTINIEYASGTPDHIAGDFDKLARVALSLVENAMKFGEGEPVRILLSYSEMPMAGSDAFQDAGTLIMDVCDQSGGIDPELVQTVIQPFIQSDMSTTRAQEGLGLGLTTVGVLCRVMGGDVTVHGDHMENGLPGTRVRVRVPAYATDGSGEWAPSSETEEQRKLRERLKRRRDEMARAVENARRAAA